MGHSLENGKFCHNSQLGIRSNILYRIKTAISMAFSFKNDHKTKIFIGISSNFLHNGINEHQKCNKNRNFCLAIFKLNTMYHMYIAGSLAIVF